jgi:Maltose operon periplasmic protein precursor (MalM)
MTARLPLAATALLVALVSGALPMPAAAADTPPPPAAPAPACCRSTDDFPWRELPAIGQGVDVTIDASSPVFKFHAGPSRFVAFRLPAGDARYRIEVRGLPAPDLQQPGGWRVFYPQAVLLDEGHLVSREAALDNAVLEPIGTELSPEGAYVLYLPVDPAQARERFLVIYTVMPEAGTDVPAPAEALRNRAAALRAASTWAAGQSDGGRLRIDVVTLPATSTTTR